MKNLTIDALFETMRMTLYNLEQDAALQKQMAQFGLSSKRIQEGKTLLKNSQHLHGQKDQQYYAWWSLSDQIKKDREAALQTFLDHVQVAKVAFRQQPGILYQLKIDKVNRKKAWDWTIQAHRFYTLIEDHTEQMKQFSIAPEELQQAKASLEALLTLKDSRMKKKGEAESATQQRNAALDALREWLLNFRAVARLAFKDDPQMLEAFGMKVPS